MSGKIPSAIQFTALIQFYKKAQSAVMAQMSQLKGCSSANPSKFIMLQFAMSNVTQVGSSISNIISQVNSVINHAVQNQITH